MFNIGPMELLVLAIVGLVVLGPDRLPGFARDAARLLRSLRDMATGAREQLRDELGPEFADIDLRNLNPRTAVARAVFGDEVPDLTKYDPRRFTARSIATDFLKGGDGASAGGAAVPGPAGAAAGRSAGGSANGTSNGRVSMSKPAAQEPPARPRPRPRPHGGGPDGGGPAGSAGSGGGRPTNRYEDTT